MTADPGSEAGAAGISAEERVKAATFWAEWDSEREGGDVVLASLAVEIAEAHASAATQAERDKWEEWHVRTTKEYSERRQEELHHEIEVLTNLSATAAAATARAEKAEAEVARLRAAINETVGNFDAMECLAGRCTDPPCLWDPIRAAIAVPARREGET